MIFLRKLLSISLITALAAGFLVTASPVTAADPIKCPKLPSDGTSAKCTQGTKKLECHLAGGPSGARVCSAGGEVVGNPNGTQIKGSAVQGPATAKDQTGNNNDPVSGKKVKDTSVIEYINQVYDWSAIFGGLLAVIMLTYAGYRYMTSYGDPEKIADAKQIIEQALIGLALLILAAIILQTINPNTAGCKTNCGDIKFDQPNGGTI